MKKTLKWFTLIEMLIVIVIIGILAAVLIPKIGWARERAEDVAVKANVRTLSTYLMWKSMDNKLSEIGTAIPRTGDDAADLPNVDSADYDNYSVAVDGHKFVVCWELEGEDWNATGEASTDLIGVSLGNEWGYYCIQG